MVSITACATVRDTDSHSPTNKMMTGTWQGGHLMKDGTQKSWQQIRNNDGSYSLYFNYIQTNGETFQATETGKWWIENGLFHEISPSRSKQPDIYQYEFYNNNTCLKFDQISRDPSGDEYDGYSFTECRFKDDI